MPWRIQTLAETRLPLLEVCYEGLLTGADLFDAGRASMAALLKQERPRMLADCTALEGGHSIFDLYELADAIMASGLAPTLREAILTPTLPMPAETVRFWETMCFNRGIQVRIFTDRQRALEWLSESPSRP